MRRVLVVAVLACGLAGLPELARAQVAPAAPGPIRPTYDCSSDGSTRADFNRDGADDVVLAAPFDDLSQSADVGSINVVYGGDEGTSSLGDQLFTPGSAGMPAFKWLFGPGRLFGKGLAAGDFNDDDYADLAVGAPGSPVDGVPNSGAVVVLFGTAEGLSTRFAQVAYQSRGIATANEAGDALGWTLAAGDFNGDGTDDLAIGAPGEDVNVVRDAGAVFVMYGKPGARPAGGGLSRTSAVAPQTIVQGRGGLLDRADAGDMFGLALATGNFDGDAQEEGRSVDDLVVGVPHEDLGLVADAGAARGAHRRRSVLAPGRSKRPGLQRAGRPLRLRAGRGQLPGPALRQRLVGRGRRRPGRWDPR
jgi:hypothetical protein